MLSEGEEYLGMHVRHGDRVEHPHIPLEVYMFRAKEFSDWTGLKTFYVSTDDQEVLDTLPVKYPEYRFISPSWGRSRGSHPTPGAEKMLTEEQKSDRSEALLMLIFEMIMLKGSKHFIGSGGSNLTNQIARLMSAEAMRKSILIINPYDDYYINHGVAKGPYIKYQPPKKD